MGWSTGSLEEIAVRLDRLERSLAIWRALGVSALAALGLMVAWLGWRGSSDSFVPATEILSSPVDSGLPAVVEAERFILKDKTGLVRATLSYSEQDPGGQVALELSPGGERVLQLVARKDGFGMLRFFGDAPDAPGGRVLLGYEEGPYCAVNDRDGRALARLYLDGAAPFLELLRGPGDPFLAIGMRNGWAYLDVFDAQGKAHPVLPDGEPGGR